MAESREIELPQTGTDASSGAPRHAGMPGWVLAFVAIGVALLVLGAVVLSSGSGGDHGPGRHNPSGQADAGQQAGAPL